MKRIRHRNLDGTVSVTEFVDDVDYWTHLYVIGIITYDEALAYGVPVDRF